MRNALSTLMLLLLISGCGSTHQISLADDPACRTLTHNIPKRLNEVFTPDYVHIAARIKITIESSDNAEWRHAFELVDGAPHLRVNKSWRFNVEEYLVEAALHWIWKANLLHTDHTRLSDEENKARSDKIKQGFKKLLQEMHEEPTLFLPELIEAVASSSENKDYEAAFVALANLMISGKIDPIQAPTEVEFLFGGILSNHLISGLLPDNRILLSNLYLQIPASDELEFDRLPMSKSEIAASKHFATLVCKCKTNEYLHHIHAQSPGLQQELSRSGEFIIAAGEIGDDALFTSTLLIGNTISAQIVQKNPDAILLSDSKGAIITLKLKYANRENAEWRHLKLIKLKTTLGVLRRIERAQFDKQLKITLQ